MICVVCGLCAFVFVSICLRNEAAVCTWLCLSFMILLICGLCGLWFVCVVLFLFLCLYVCATRLQAVHGTLVVYDLADL